MILSLHISQMLMHSAALHPDLVLGMTFNQLMLIRSSAVAMKQIFPCAKEELVINVNTVMMQVSLAVKLTNLSLSPN